MTAMIDTLKFAKNFELAGFAKPQAEALTAMMAEMNSRAREDLAITADLRDVDNGLRSEVASRNEARGELNVAVAELKTEVTTTVSTAKWQILWRMSGSQLFVVAAVVILSNVSKFFR